MSCEHDCATPPLFPALIHNRPGLRSIDYRIGDYTRLREHMLDTLDKAQLLDAWTHRGADDPGIALLEAAAEVGDILTFYQTLYANEAYLRTANWRESVSALVQLLGYRLAPGIGGEALFAVAVKGEHPVTVPAGFGFKAQLEGDGPPAQFESTKAVTAHPALNRFHLYRPRRAPQSIAIGMTELELTAVAGQTDLPSRAAVDLSEGDRIMLVPESDMFEVSGMFTEQAKAEILVVKEVETVLDRMIVRFQGALTVNRGTRVRAYKIDRSFRHFGHDAPVRIARLNETTGMVNFELTRFIRGVNASTLVSSADVGFYSSLSLRTMPLDTEVDDLAGGGKLILNGDVRFDGRSTPTSLTVVRDIAEVTKGAMTWGGITGSCSFAILKQQVVTNISIIGERVDIRRFQLHEVVSPELTLQAPTRWRETSSGELAFFGTYAEAKRLAGRSLLLQDAAGEVQPAVVVTQPEDVTLAGRDSLNFWMWVLTLDKLPAFSLTAFDEVEPQVVTYANLVPTNQGKTEDEAVLGSGDRRQSFQTFALPKSPLTYLLDETRTPAQTPALEVWVEGIRWERVETFFSSGPVDQVYVLRQDVAGTSYVQFGDGNTGSCLPSGRNNVVVRFRTGIGARGRLAADATPAATDKLKEIDEIYLPGPAVGGGDSETEASARIAAPGSMQSLGRLVGLADFEAEGLALPGVLKARAYWAVTNGVPQVCLAVLTESAEAEDIAKVQESMNTFNRCRGSARHAIKVIRGLRQYLHLVLRVGYEANRRGEDVRVAATAALGVMSEQEAASGLFALSERGFGLGAHLSQMLGAVQQVPGVRWVEADALQAIPLGSPPETDPEALTIPSVPVLEQAVSCPSNRVLALHDRHLELKLSRVETAKECEP